MIHGKTGLTLADVTSHMSWGADAHHAHELLFVDVKGQQLMGSNLRFLLENAGNKIDIFFIVETELESKMDVVILLPLLALQQVLISHFFGVFLKQGPLGNLRVLCHLLLIVVGSLVPTALCPFSNIFIVYYDCDLSMCRDQRLCTVTGHLFDILS